MYGKKGVELSINTVIIVIIAVIALVLILFIFSSAMREFALDIITKLKNALGLYNASSSALK
ncbi:MAG: hypothetical protein K6T16_00480 [Candidatus Pacearchaeota archaeon]|nr:hypothetical protein [Candidatus Pacearchaeota archaeon]